SNRCRRRPQSEQSLQFFQGLRRSFVRGAAGRRKNVGRSKAASQAAARAGRDAPHSPCCARAGTLAGSFARPVCSGRRPVAVDRAKARSDRLRAQAEKLRQRLIQTAARVQTLEKQKLELDAKIRSLAARYNVLAQGFRRDRVAVAKLLAVIERLQHDTPPAIA